jgi:archaellum biogenesis ATPase FlaH
MQVFLKQLFHWLSVLSLYHSHRELVEEYESLGWSVEDHLLPDYILVSMLHQYSLLYMHHQQQNLHMTNYSSLGSL